MNPQPSAGQEFSDNASRSVANRALRRGVERLCLHTVESALSAGADPNLWSQSGEPILCRTFRALFESDRATGESKAAKIAAALLDAGALATVEVRPSTGRRAISSPLSWLCYLPVGEELGAIRRRMIEQGANVNWLSPSGDTLFHLLGQCSVPHGVSAQEQLDRKIQTARDLMRAGADWSAKNAQGKTPEECYALWAEEHPRLGLADLVGACKSVWESLELERAALGAPGPSLSKKSASL